LTDIAINYARHHGRVNAESQTFQGFFKRYVPAYTICVDARFRSFPNNFATQTRYAFTAPAVNPATR